MFPLLPTLLLCSCFDVAAAAAGGIYCWSSQQPDTYQLLLPASCHGGTCESLCLHYPDTTIVASFRAPLAAAAAAVAAPRLGSGAMLPTAAAPVHVKAQLAAGPAAAPLNPVTVAAAAAAGYVDAASGIGAGVCEAVRQAQQQLLPSSVCMWGHSSSKAMTHGCLLPAMQEAAGEESVLFASADEASCQPRLWGCSSGRQVVPAAPWEALPSPVLQLSGGRSDGFGALLLGALCESQLVLYSYEC